MSDETLNDDFGSHQLEAALALGKPIEEPAYVPVDPFAMVADMLARKNKFTNAQMDICTEVIITMLPQEEREIFREISEQNDNYPLWIVLLAQWRRSKENAECFALLVDPEWTAKAEEK